MLRSIQINGYRGIKNIKIDDLSKINIILGENNLGKTSILESVFGIACGTNILSLIETALMRRNNVLGVFDFIEKIIGCFNNISSEELQFSYKSKLNDKEIKITHKLTPSRLFKTLIPNNKLNNLEIAIDNNNNQNIDGNLIGIWEVYFNDNLCKKVKLNFPSFDIALGDEPIVSAKFNDILNHRNQQENTVLYSQLKRERILDEFIDELSKTFGEIKDIDSIPYPDGSSAPVSIIMGNDRYIPLYSFGDGLQRWFNILGSMVYNKNSIHCIEEIDVTFHANAQKQLASNLVYYSEKFNNQLFMTSHSIEFIDNFLAGIPEDKLDFVRIITLKQSDSRDSIKHRVLTGREALNSRELYGMELR